MNLTFFQIYLSSALVLLSSWAYYMSSNNAVFFGGALISTCGVFYTGEIMRKVVGNVYIHKEDLTKVIWSLESQDVMPNFI